MKVSLKWLRDFVDIDVTPDELAHRLTMAGLEAESVEKVDGDIDKLIAAKVESVERHPNADKLNLCKVNTGAEVLDVVCGAPNVAAGQTVVFAPVGTNMPNGMKIEVAKIRGVKSYGMLCSLAELKLEEKSKGIHVFDTDIKIGTPIAPILGLDDVTYDLNVTPNRPDALSIIGVAREIAAFLGKPLKTIEPKLPESDKDVNKLASVTIDDFKGCPRYVARVITGVKIGPSAPWMQSRLKACGMRPINNIVDVTNYVMFETGQPLHAFDLAELNDRKIIVKRAKAGEDFTTLDNAVRKMTATDLMICDAKGPVAIAGVMGGLHSEVTENTTEILLESACFDPGSIRATSKRLGLSTEASYRFERAVDPELQLRACNRAIGLMLELAGGEIARGAIDVKTDIPKPKAIKLRDKRVSVYLGFDISRKATVDLLAPLGMTVEEQPDGLMVTPPTFRPDMKEEADVIEEIARRYNYDLIPTTLPKGRVEPINVSCEARITSIAREALVGAGYFEAVTLTFMNPTASDWLKLANDDARRKTVKLLNPLSSQEGALRTSLLPGLFGAVAHNLNRFQYGPRFFEIGRVFISEGENKLPTEIPCLSGAYAPSTEKSLYKSADSFYEMKGAVEELLRALRINADFVPADDVSYLLPGEAAGIYSGGKKIGIMGRVKPSVAKNFDVETPLYAFEVDFPTVSDLFSEEVHFEKLPVYPPSFRDVSLIVEEETRVADMQRAVIRVDSNIRDARLFDVYRGKPVPDGRKSVAFSITYGWQDKSPSDEEVNALHQRVMDILRKEFGAETR